MSYLWLEPKRKSLLKKNTNIKRGRVVGDRNDAADRERGIFILFCKVEGMLVYGCDKKNVKGKGAEKETVEISKAH